MTAKRKLTKVNGEQPEPTVTDDHVNDVVDPHPDPNPEVELKEQEQEALTNTDQETLNVRKREFPALSGEEGLEVAKRGADIHEVSTTTWRKVFVVKASNFSDTEDFHKPQYNATRQEAINSGVRFVGDVRFTESTPHGDGVSLNLVYEAEVEPAVTADPPVANSPANQDRAHELAEKRKEAEKQDGTNDEDTK